MGLLDDVAGASGDRGDVAYPLAFATYYSFRRVLPNLAGEFIGLENYAQMLEDEDH